ncbi:MAG: DUF2807 domain-containing protein [Thermoanaerobaculia bacterium]
MRARKRISRRSQGRKHVRLALMLAGAIGLLACNSGGGGGGNSITGPGAFVVGSGVTVTETRAVSGINGVAISGVGLLIIEQTGSESLTVTAEENILPLLTVDIVGDLLILGIQANTQINTSQEIVYRLTVRAIDRISASGAARVEATGLNTSFLEATLSGATAATLSGTAQRQTVNASGASRYDAAGLSSRFATVDISGASSAVLRVSDRLEGVVSGVAVLEYYGDPVVTIAGGGSARRIGG